MSKHIVQPVTLGERDAFEAILEQVTNWNAYGPLPPNNPKRVLKNDQFWVMVFSESANQEAYDAVAVAAVIRNGFEVKAGSTEWRWLLVESGELQLLFVPRYFGPYWHKVLEELRSLVRYENGEDI